MASTRPVSRKFRHTSRAHAAEAAPPSIAVAPPMRSNVFVIRDASELLVKLPVSSTIAGSLETTRSQNFAQIDSIASLPIPRD